MEDKTIAVTTGRKEYLERMTDFLAPLFIEDAAICYMLTGMSDEQRRSYIRQYFHVLLKAAYLNHGEFQEAQAWSCGAVWMPPGKKIDNIMTILPAGFAGCLFHMGIGGIKRMLFEYSPKQDEAKKKGLKGIKKFHYLFFIGTAVEARGQGLASKIVQRKQAEVNAATRPEDRIPIWLEASSKGSQRVYSRCGFRTVDTIVLGKGTHGANGLPAKDGPGVEIYAMIWTPEGFEMPEK